MIDALAIAQLLSAYKTHGWILRRLLLTQELKQRLGDDLDTLFGRSELVDSDIDAAWFSRRPSAGEVAWEIRYLGDSPFALLEMVDENAVDFEARLKAVEIRLRESIAARQSA